MSRSIEVALTKGMKALVSEEDAYDVIHMASWYAHHSAHGKFYAASRIKGLGFIYLHQYVAKRMKLEVLDEIDHVNGDGLDNQRHNLQPATHQQNMHNRGAQRNNLSCGVKGVTWHSIGKKWMAQLTVARKGTIWVCLTQ